MLKKARSTNDVQYLVSSRQPATISPRRTRSISSSSSKRRGKGWKAFHKLPKLNTTSIFKCGQMTYLGNTGAELDGWLVGWSDGWLELAGGWSSTVLCVGGYGLGAKIAITFKWKFAFYMNLLWRPIFSPNWTASKLSPSTKYSSPCGLPSERSRWKINSPNRNPKKQQQEEEKQ